MRAEKIKYPMGTLTSEGALIYDENVSGKRPAVLLAPNWMGVTDKAMQRGELVAANRYVVFVADMYGAETRPADFGGRFGQPAAGGRGRAAQACAGRIRRYGRAGGQARFGRSAAGGGGVLLRRRQRPGACARRRRSSGGGFDPWRPQDRAPGEAGGDQGGALLVAHGVADPMVPKADRDGNECRRGQVADGGVFRGPARLHRSRRRRSRSCRLRGGGAAANLRPDTPIPGRCFRGPPVSCRRSGGLDRGFSRSGGTSVPHSAAGLARATHQGDRVFHRGLNRRCRPRNWLALRCAAGRARGGCSKLCRILRCPL